MPTSDGWSKTWTFYDGDWHEGNVPIMGVRSHAAWLGSMVFDGARAFEGVAPDLDLHFARVDASAKTFFLDAKVPIESGSTSPARGCVGSTLRVADARRAAVPDAAEQFDPLWPELIGILGWQDLPLSSRNHGAGNPNQHGRAAR